jgi:hypothetical protein
MEKALSWDETKIGLRGVPRHPKGHARVRYGIFFDKLCHDQAEPSSFDLKLMQPQRGRSFLLRYFLVNCFSQGLNFIPASRWHKMTPRESLSYFDFFN